MNAMQRHPGTPTYHSQSARKGRAASHRVPRYRPKADTQRDICASHFKAGFLCGLVLGLAALAIVIWFWAVPTVERANRDAASAIATSYGQVYA